MSYYNDISVSTTIDAETDVLNQLTDNRLILEIKNRGYRVFNGDEEIAINKDEEIKLHKEDRLSIDVEIDGYDALSELYDDDIKEYLEERGYSVYNDPSDIFKEDPENIIFEMAEKIHLLGHFDVLAILSNWMKSKRYYDKTQFKEYINSLIDDM